MAETVFHSPPESLQFYRNSVSPRGLNRRFQEIGTTYQEVVADVRKDLALNYLRSGQFSVEEISDLLGYSNASNFGKAFKAWTGFSPSQYPFD